MPHLNMRRHHFLTFFFRKQIPLTCLNKRIDKKNNEKLEAGKGLSKTHLGGVIILLGIMVGAGYFLFMPEPESASASTSESISSSQESTARVVVYKSPTCGCCNKWADHLRAAGFEVVSHDRNDMVRIKSELGIARPLQSCHTAIVEGYAVEGHVPAKDIKRLLQERPAIAGLAVPGMPIGSPGMEMEDHTVEPYDVLSFDKQGNTEIFTEYRTNK